MRTFIILALALLLTACGSDTPPDIAKIVQGLMGAAGLAAARAHAGNAARHYLEQRTRYLVGKNSSWGSETGYPHLVARISYEMRLLNDFLTERMAALTGTDTKTPAHRDLEDAAKRLTSDGPTAIAEQKRTYLADRKERIAQIVWRAGAIHAELWDGGDSTPLPSLKKDALTELLDRRLHSVEMLMLHDEWKVVSWSVDSATSGWKDGQRTSMFQYPWVRLTDSNFADALTAKGLSVGSLGPDWGFPPNVTDEIKYKFGVDLAQRMRPATANEWIWDGRPYVMTLKPGVTDVAAALGRIMPESPKIDSTFEDFLQRSLLYCDIMLALLHLEGLRFARKRRTNSDSDFNTSAAKGVTLSSFIPEAGPPGPQYLMKEGAKWFDGVAIEHDQLQIGDHLIFWNNQYVRFILHSAFGLENSYVTRITNDGSVMLAGHGMTEKSEQEFALEMAKVIQDQYAAFIDAINKSASTTWLKVTKHVPYDFRFLLVNWAPFGETFKPGAESNFTRGGAWWIRLPLQLLHDWNKPPPTVAEALAWLPKSVSVQPGMLQPPSPPPDVGGGESIYLPLEQPQGVHGGWPEYFANPPLPGATVILDELIPDGEMIPGFYKLGAAQKSKIPVLRPKVLT